MIEKEKRKMPLEKPREGGWGFVATGPHMDGDGGRAREGEERRDGGRGKSKRSLRSVRCRGSNQEGGDLLSRIAVQYHRRARA